MSTVHPAGGVSGMRGSVAAGVAMEPHAPGDPSLDGSTGRDRLAAAAEQAGLKRVQLVAWRDLDDPEAGGSELHAHRIATRWADAGLDVTLRTSAVPGRASLVQRSGYHVVRRSGRYGVFPNVAWHGARLEPRSGEGLVEIWNGMPFFSPLWFRGPRIVFLHHVHAEMWGMTLPGWLARFGEAVERVFAPPFYRSSRVVTLSESSRQEIVEMLGLPAERVSVTPPGVERRFQPGGRRSPVPLVVAVGRLVPVKRFDILIDCLARVRETCTDLRAVIIGEGYERPRLEELRHRAGADDWLELPGHLDDEEVVDWYRRAWVVASTSRREGWGMTLTEAGACGTPAVATRIAGHLDAVVEGRTGILAERRDELTAGLRAILSDAVLRRRLSEGALEHARSFTWETTAQSTLEALASEARRRRSPRLAGV